MPTPILACAFACLAATSSPASDPVTPPAPAASEAPAANERVGGDREPEARFVEGMWRSGKLFIDSPLPVGYPAPTPPGAIELKRYPSVRRAEFKGSGDTDRAGRRGFYPLFDHIQRNGIAMTAPVEMDVPGWSAEADAAPREWTMSFLYRTPELRETGREGEVVVRDTAPLTVVSIGTRGAYGRSSMNRPLAELEAWIGAHPAWERAGPPRWCAYNGPYVPRTNRWGEVQIPIRRTGDETAEASDESVLPGAGAAGAGS